ncbi:MAG: exonuclease domain-containing protein [Lamprobacter sp.]|uniref:exonuclease domain-containing protein n=1 Tax=Lamprobacter sp. TaxID=3100796 RepID=UPI002B263053|nr:exonuclease domain-containing protein [Lamprobacter sp.]MEA3642900.1 exonuclease domain-containing protein [Lamprobacter sp.]
MHSTPWLLLDTETTGFKPPIFVVELAAQRMRGWEPEGEPFVRLLDHGVAIPPEAARVNGYTREILERDGEPPSAVYDAFADYAETRPLVAYNLSYDLDQVLRPEWQRLGRAPIGRHGFCALRLAQRLLDPVPAGNCKLQTLRQFYRLPARGAHTALGDVETVVDLLQQVLRPLAEARGLTTWETLSAYAEAPWFPSRLAFGKYKGRDFREARHDADLRGWLEWLAASSTPRSAEMGRWYLDRLDDALKSDPITPATLLIDLDSETGAGLILYRDPERETLNRLIDAARTRLAELEAESAREHQTVAVIQARLFERLRPLYQRRDALQIVIDYRRRYLDLLLIEGEDAAEAATADYAQARADTEREYEDAAAEAGQQRELTEDEARELKTLFRQLVKLYHPDRYAHDPERQAIHERLMQEINQARDQGDIDRLREIARDPNAFLARQGLAGLDFSDDADLTKLRQLYDSLQGRILATLEELARLRESHDYELHRLSQQRPELLDNVADAQAETLRAEIATLQTEADRLAAEITTLTGSPEILTD